MLCYINILGAYLRLAQMVVFTEFMVSGRSGVIISLSISISCFSLFLEY